MGKSKVEGVREHQLIDRGATSNKRQTVVGGQWLRVSYERSDGWIQVQYILFDSRGCVHSFVDGAVSAATERWNHNVDETSRVCGGTNCVELVSRAGWSVWRMVREMD